MEEVLNHAGVAYNFLACARMLLTASSLSAGAGWQVLPQLCFLYGPLAVLFPILSQWVLCGRRSGIAEMRDASTNARSIYLCSRPGGLAQSPQPTVAFPMSQRQAIPRMKSDTLEDALQTRIENAIDDYLADGGRDSEVKLRRCWRVLEKQSLSVRCALFEEAKRR